LTLGLIESKLKEHRILRESELHEFKPGDRVQLGPFEVEPVHITHSIPGAVTLAIRTPLGIVVHTGDYKFDQTPLDGQPPDMGRLAELGRQGVELLLGDSTNASRPGFSASERVVAQAIDDIMRDAKGRVLVATFASNVYRVQEVIQASVRYGRRVALVGRSMMTNTETAHRLGYIDVPKDVLLKLSDLENHAPSELTLLCTGSQGEPLSALTRIAAGEHPAVQLMPEDTVILSASPIPGNEELVYRTINNLYRAQARVFYSQRDLVHASGHGSVEELRLMLSLLRPRNFMPVHGDYRLLVHHAELAADMGIDRDRIVTVENGAVVELTREGLRVVDQLPVSLVFVDGLGIGDISHAVLRDRKHLAQDGIFIVVVTVNSDTGEVVSGPEIISRGFLPDDGAAEILNSSRKRVLESLAPARRHGAPEWAVLKEDIRQALSKYLYDRTRRRPMIIPVITEI
jgi:ribonuclease J